MPVSCISWKHQQHQHQHQLRPAAGGGGGGDHRLDDLCCLAFCCSTRNTKQRPQPSHYLWKQQRQQWQLQLQQQRQQHSTPDPSTYPPITPIDQYWGWQTRCSSGDVSKMYSESGGHFEIVVGSLFRERGGEFLVFIDSRLHRAASPSLAKILHSLKYKTYTTFSQVWSPNPPNFL